MTASKNSRFLRLAGLCGVLAPILSFGLIFYAVSISPWFSWQTDALSDLGVYPRSSALPFNVALMSGGILNVLLVLGVGHWIGRGWLGGMGTVASLVGAVALGLIGVLPESIRAPHWMAAATYFGYAHWLCAYRSGDLAQGAAGARRIGYRGCGGCIPGHDLSASRWPGGARVDRSTPVVDSRILHGRKALLGG